MSHASDRPQLVIVIDFPETRHTFCNPVELIAAYTDEEVKAGLCRLRAAATEGLWAAGYIAYDAASAIEPRMRTRDLGGTPRLLFGLFESPQVDQAEPPVLPFYCTAWTPDVGEEAYAAGVSSVRELIAAGQTYQINYTFRLHAALRGDAYSYYRAMRAAGGGRGYCAYIKCGSLTVLSLSPELFFRTDGRTITAKPMKGTVPRGLTAEEDEAKARWLRASEKNRAENVMIVDLMRNDLGRIAETGSIQVTDLFAIESYATVHQMVSVVQGTLKHEIYVDDILRALFPSGSVTGAPKISSMAAIDGLEGAPRGVYCGAVGLIRPDGDCVFNVAIRTAVIDTIRGEASCGVGGAITWDSEAADERREALLKGEFLRAESREFALLESLSLADGVYYLCERHMDRLQRSAAYFGYPFKADQIHRAMAHHAADHAAGLHKTRLLLHGNGTVEIESSPIRPLSGEPLPVAVSDDPVSSSDIFLYHKTTQRRAYETRRARHPDVFDVLLVNERGELTEFTIANLVIERDGAKWTPPVTSGLLPGTMRGELIAAGEIQEKQLLPDDLRSAARIWHINSVRGWTPVRIVGMEGVT